MQAPPDELFNRELIQAVCGPEHIAAFDPSYLAKSGKHTPGVGWHWSGSAGKAKWGLEIGGLAGVDVELKHPERPKRTACRWLPSCTAVNAPNKGVDAVLSSPVHGIERIWIGSELHGRLAPRAQGGWRNHAPMLSKVGGVVRHAHVASEVHFIGVVRADGGGIHGATTANAPARPNYGVFWENPNRGSKKQKSKKGSVFFKVGECFIRDLLTIKGGW